MENIFLLKVCVGYLRDSTQSWFHLLSMVLRFMHLSVILRLWSWVC